MQKDVKKNGLIIVILLCVAAIGIMTYISTRPVISDQLADLQAGDISKFDGIEVDPDLVDIADEAPQVVETAKPEVIEKTPAPEKKVEEKKPVTPKKLTFSLPLKGDVLFDFSGDDLVLNKTLGDYRVHSGIDIAGKEGDKVYCISDGKVQDVVFDDMLGWTVIINHSNGVQSRYSNLMSGVLVKKGADVKGGTVIGGLGQSAGSETLLPPHLHFEIWQDQKPISPMEYMNKNK